MANTELVVVFKGQDSGLTSTTNKTLSTTDKLKSSFSKLGAVMTPLNQGLELAKKGYQLFDQVIGESIRLANEQERVETQLAQTIKSTGGAAGLTAQEIKTMASELQNVTTYGDEAIIGGQNLLLTFTNIGEDVFPRATETMLDMSTALGQDLKSSAIQLGKAINDPVQGVTALQRVGVSFTDQQKEQIRVMQESGDLMGAQTLILDELAKEFGGNAAAAAQTFQGRITQVQNAVGDMGEELGFAITKSDDINTVLTTISTEVLPGLSTTLTSKVVPAFEDFIAAGGDLISIFGDSEKSVEDFTAEFTSGFLGPIDKGAVGLRYFTTALSTPIDQFPDFIRRTEEANGDLEEMRRILDGLNGEFGGTTGTGLTKSIEATGAVVSTTTYAFQDMRDTVYDVDGVVRDLIASAEAVPLQEINAGIIQTIPNISLAAFGTGELTDAFNEWGGSIEIVSEEITTFQPALASLESHFFASANAVGANLGPVGELAEKYGLTTEQAGALALAEGLITEAELNHMIQTSLLAVEQEKLIAQFAAGDITAAQYAEQLAQAQVDIESMTTAVNTGSGSVRIINQDMEAAAVSATNAASANIALKQSLLDLPTEINIDVNQNYHQTGQLASGGELHTAGERALGGPVNMGRSYLVGESGSELFVPTTNGEIINNNNFSGLVAGLNRLVNTLSNPPQQQVIYNVNTPQFNMGMANRTAQAMSGGI